MFSGFGNLIRVLVIKTSFYMENGDKQCCNKWGVGGRVPPETSDREISADLLGKKRQGKKGKGVKIEKKRRKIYKREGGKVKMKS